MSSSADRSLLSSLALARGTLDREAHRRTDADWLRQQWHTAGAQVLVVHEARAPLTADSTAEQPRLHLLPAATSGFDCADAVFLGRDGEAAYFAVITSDEAIVTDIAPSSHWADLRAVGAELGDTDAGLLVTSVALSHWHEAHPRCARCGAATAMSHGGWVRRCPEDGSEHYPRTDPAVIVLVRDDADRALLGRQARWPSGWFSTLAGFVEPGESAEDAVRREVHEESGVSVGEVAYLGSQPWPFPCSLMLGYHAWATSTSIDVDGTEITEARWFSREELTAECSAGTVALPPAVSIARRLIDRWFGEPIPGDWTRPVAGR